MARITELTVNGTRQRIDVAAERSLLGVLRDDLDLTASHAAAIAAFSASDASARAWLVPRMRGAPTTAG